jgi:hypothetical protein
LGVLDLALLCLQQKTKDVHVLYATSAFPAARSRSRQIGLVEVFSTTNLISVLTFLNCNKFIERITQDMFVLKVTYLNEFVLAVVVTFAVNYLHSANNLFVNCATSAVSCYAILTVQSNDSIIASKAIAETTKCRSNYYCLFGCKNAFFSVIVCDVTLSVYPHRASLKIVPGHGGNRTYDLWNTTPMLDLTA